MSPELVDINKCLAVGSANRWPTTGDSLARCEPFSGVGFGRSIVINSSGFSKSMITSSRGATARKRILLTEVRHNTDEGGEYCTKDNEKRGDSACERTDGMKPVSSFPKYE